MSHTSYLCWDRPPLDLICDLVPATHRFFLDRVGIDPSDMATAAWEGYLAEAIDRASGQWWAFEQNCDDAKLYGVGELWDCRTGLNDDGIAVAAGFWRTVAGTLAELGCPPPMGVVIESENHPGWPFLSPWQDRVYERAKLVSSGKIEGGSEREQTQAWLELDSKVRSEALRAIIIEPWAEGFGVEPDDLLCPAYEFHAGIRRQDDTTWWMPSASPDQRVASPSRYVKPERWHKPLGLPNDFATIAAKITDDYAQCRRLGLRYVPWVANQPKVLQLVESLGIERVIYWTGDKRWADPDRKTLRDRLAGHAA